MIDLTLPRPEANLGSYQVRGGDDFVHVLLEEVKPFVRTRYKVDESRQTLYGKSLGVPCHENSFLPPKPPMKQAGWWLSPDAPLDVFTSVAHPVSARLCSVLG